MELDFDKYCLVDGSPTTVLPAPRHHCLEVTNKKASGKPKYRNDILILNQEFLEINFSQYCCASRSDVQAQGVSNELLKEATVSQSSQEVGRKKIEFSQGRASECTYGIIDSLCGSDEDSSLVEENNSSGIMSLSTQSHEANCPQERDVAVNLLKSLSARFALPHLPAKSESVTSRASSPKPRFSPVRKMLDPLVKSNSHRSPLSSSNKTVCGTRSEHTGINHNKTICRLLLDDIAEVDENCNSAPRYSPAHLHGLLKLGNKHGAPFFDFSVKSMDDAYVAKTWKAENGLTWIYTFHSLHHRRKSNTSGWGFRDSYRASTMVGQMHVTCHICQEFKGSGEFNDTMVMEFVSYDAIHSRKSESSQDNTPHSRPLSAADLRPELEIAAIIMEVPLEKRESLKLKSGDKKIDESLPHLLDLGKAKEGISDISNAGMIHAVIPAGNHSLPATESRGPLPLLDRWRFGGGCDCGGWDMACPLNVLSNPNVNIAKGQPLVDNQNLAELFVQGRKDNTPAFVMRAIEDGEYAVDFHAQLSSLQAFSISIAILHAVGASTVVGQDKGEPSLQSDSMRVFAEEEIKTMIDTIAEEEKSKVNKKMEHVLPSFVLNPPFSPIARV